MALLFPLLILSLLSQNLCKPLLDETVAAKYLETYGYITKPSVSSSSSSGPASYKKQDPASAIRKFQEFTGLPATGVIDKATIAKMEQPRCGVADYKASSSSSSSSSIGSYVIRATGWTQHELTWRVTDYKISFQLYHVIIDQLLAKAFDTWMEKIGKLSFRHCKECPGESADINIKFGAKYHGDDYPFDGPGSVLAHAFYPVYGGDIHFDNDETWTGSVDGGINFFQVAVHEIGHSLGLQHSGITTAVMAPVYTPYSPDHSLHSDDIQGIQALYGVNACLRYARIASGDFTHRRFETYGDKCYLFYTESGLSWLEARRFCQRLGSDLIAIEDYEEYKFMLGVIDADEDYSMVGSETGWIVGGLRKEGSKTDHYWVSTGADMKFHGEWGCNLETCNTYKSNKYVNIGPRGYRKWNHSAYLVNVNLVCEKKQSDGATSLDDSDNCKFNPCQNGGTCTDFEDGYTCKCVDGYRGSNCEDDINECASEPCLNRGTCEDLVNKYICTCKDGFGGVNCQNNIAVLYTDLSLDVEGGGWRLIQQRTNPLSDGAIWDTNWEGYKSGFGSSSSAYWLGLAEMHSLTSDGRNWELMVQVRWESYDKRAKHWSHNGEVGWIIHDNFRIDSEANKFAIHVGRLTKYHAFSYEEDTTFSVKKFFGYVNGVKFSTKDADNDNWPDKNCSLTFRGNGWWANNCWHVNLNTNEKISYWFGHPDKVLMAMRPK